jgi:hypothetical protein
MMLAAVVLMDPDKRKIVKRYASRKLNELATETATVAGVGGVSGRDGVENDHDNHQDEVQPLMMMTPVDDDDDCDAKRKDNPWCPHPCPTNQIILLYYCDYDYHYFNCYNYIPNQSQEHLYLPIHVGYDNQQDNHHHPRSDSDNDEPHINHSHHHPAKDRKHFDHHFSFQATNVLLVPVVIIGTNQHKQRNQQSPLFRTLRLTRRLI